LIGFVKLCAQTQAPDSPSTIVNTALLSRLFIALAPSGIGPDLH
jgi:hypothetical protein